MANHSQQHHGSSGQHEAHDPWQHYAHIAHKAHAAAEGVEYAGHVLKHSAEHVQHVQAAAKLAKAHGQLGYDLRRMANAVSKLERVAKDGGARGAKAFKQLENARAALKAAQAEYQLEQRAVQAANGVLHQFRLIKNSAKGASAAKLGEAAITFEAFLTTSRIGRTLLTTGRIVSSKTFVRSLVVVGAAAEAVASYADSTAQTTTGKVANAALGAGAGSLTMLNPYVAVGDLIAPEGYKLSELYHGSAGAVTAIGEGVLANDTKAMDDFHKRSMQGHYGKVLQAASEAGEFWAQKGIEGGLKEFVESIHWWVSS